MRLIYADYNPYTNSIDVNTFENYILRIDCNKVEEGFSKIGVVEMLYCTPECIIRVATFCYKTVDMWVPFQWTPKGVQNANKTWNKIF